MLPDLGLPIFLFITECEQRTLHGALVLTLAMLLRFMNCRFIIIIIIIIIITDFWQCVRWTGLSLSVQSTVKCDSSFRLVVSLVCTMHASLRWPIVFIFCAFVSRAFPVHVFL